MSQIAIYQNDSGEVTVKLEQDTVWLSLQQIAEVFGRDKSVISRHLRNVFNEGELDHPAVVAKMQQLPQMAKRTKSSSLTWMPSCRWATGSTLAKAPAFANGPPACCAST